MDEKVRAAYNNWYETQPNYLPVVSSDAFAAGWDAANMASAPPAPASERELRELVAKLLEWKLVDGSADAHHWRKYWKPQLERILNRVGQPPQFPFGSETWPISGESKMEYARRVNKLRAPSPRRAEEEP